MNEEKMVEVLARIEDENARHAEDKFCGIGLDMSHWGLNKDPECGTTACLAGHAALMDGWDFGHVGLNATFVKHGTERLAPYVGANVLGLTDDEAEDLFYLDSLDSVYEVAAEKMGVDETVLRDKVTAQRTFVP